MSTSYENFVTVNFKDFPKKYFFAVDNIDLKYGDYAVVETDVGLELVEVIADVKPVRDIEGDFTLKPIFRKASRRDIANYDRSLELGDKAIEVTKRAIKKLKLKMNPLSAKYSLDLSRVLITYVAEERVDFRELLQILNKELSVRIELKQIGERDKAKLISGLATCGMETCCSRYMNEFNMVSINMAKNQNLAINVSKLSGLCGKFMCCLRYENDDYKEMRKEYPPVNTKVMYKGQSYHVNSLNYLAEEAKLVNREETIFVNFNEAFYDYNRQMNNMADKTCKCPKKQMQ
ncbi:MAG: stage 0 sporulation protein [Erysipelothrix sp.]|nr:stage 0 sporulation protein [Erysipelothrix sp.]